MCKTAALTTDSVFANIVLVVTAHLLRFAVISGFGSAGVFFGLLVVVVFVVVGAATVVVAVVVVVVVFDVVVFVVVI